MEDIWNYPKAPSEPIKAIKHAIADIADPRMFVVDACQ